MKKRQTIAPTMILISMILLIGFNIFWLKKSYEEQQEVLQKELDNSLEKSYSELQDSLIRKQLIGITPQKPKKIANNPKAMSKIKTSAMVMVKLDSTARLRTFSDSTKDKVIQIFLSNSSNSSDTSSKKMLSRVLANFKNTVNSPIIEKLTIRIDSSSKKNHQDEVFENGSLNTEPESNISWESKQKLEKTVSFVNKKTIDAEKPTETNFVINLNNLKIEPKRVEDRLNKKLSASNIPLKYQVTRTNLTKTNLPKASVSILSANSQKEESLVAINRQEYQYFLLKKILPEFSFSIFLIALTSFSFGLIYKNLRKQEKLAILKNDFISNVTHELKTPITTVGVAIEALNNFNVLQNQEKTKEYLEISKNELNRLSIMVDKVLKTAIFEQKDIELKFEKNDLMQIVQKVISTMKLQFEKYQAQINLDFKGDNFEIECDNIHLTNVIYNLIENALKYSKNPQILVNVSEEANQLIFMITDNGLGIPKEYQTKVFDKFFRVPSGDVHDIKGYGLGLSYVKSVVEKHNGSIDVESEIGKGTTFKITLNKT